MKRSLTLFSLVALICLAQNLISETSINDKQRSPASIEKRATAEEKAERLKQEKDIEEKAKLLFQLKGELAEIEAYNATMAQGLLQIEMYRNGPLASISENNEGLANYLKLVEQNKTYQYQDLQGLIQYGEMQDQAYSLYYGLPMASRQEPIDAVNQDKDYFVMDPLQSRIIEIN